MKPRSTATSTFGAAYVDWLVRHRRFVLSVALVLVALAGWRTVLTYSSLRSELEALLPRSAPSVAALSELRKRLPGQRFLGIVVDTGPRLNVAEAERFIDDLSARLKEYPPGKLLAVRKDLSIEREFLERYALQLMNPSDVARLREAVEKRRDWEASRELDLGLDDEETSAPPDVPVEELQEKYLRKLGKAPHGEGGRFTSADRKTAVLVVQVNSHTTGISDDRALLNRIATDIDTLGFPAAYDSAMAVGFAADVPARVEEMNGLYADLVVSGIIVALLVFCVVVWFFRSWRAVPILGLPLLFGTLYTFGIVALPPLGIDSLNTNTTFLGSVIVGNGVNTGIILLARFAELRGEGLDPRAALSVAIQSTYKPTLAAAAAAAAAYGSLVLTDFRGFSQFGWIGSAGMLVCWATTFILAPLMILAFASSIRASTQSGGLAVGLAGGFRWALQRPGKIVVASIALSVLSAVGLFYRDSSWIEHDYSKLRRRDSFVSGERYWGARMDSTLGRYLTPTVIMASTARAALQIEKRVEALRAADAAGGLIATVRSAEQVLPKTRGDSVKEARRLDRVLTPRLRANLNPKVQAFVQRALSPQSLLPLDSESLPGALVSGLREKDGRMGRTLLIYPKTTGGTWEGPRIKAFTEDLRNAAKSVDSEAKVAGSIPLSSDITAAMTRDGPRATLFGLVAALVVCALAFRSWRSSFMAMAALLVGGLWMIGALAWTPATLNFANFVVLTITCGISADYAINVLRRSHGSSSSSNRESLEKLAHTCSAVTLCSTTTIIGFGSLLAAQSNVLFTFGIFAVAGELTMLLTATLLLPSALALIDRLRHHAEVLPSNEIEVRP